MVAATPRLVHRVVVCEGLAHVCVEFWAQSADSVDAEGLHVRRVDVALERH